MNWNFEIIDFISFFVFTLVLYLLSILSRRLGEVLGMKRYYYLYYVGMFFTLSGSIIMTLSLTGFDNPRLFGYGFFALGLTFGLIASIKYWGWLIKELVRG